jgi:hypothetical protein
MSVIYISPLISTVNSLCLALGIIVRLELNDDVYVHAIQHSLAFFR